MSATISRPVAGQHKSAAPFGAVAVLAAVVAFGAIGIAVSQNVRTAAPAGPDIQAAKDYPDQIAARLGTPPTVTDYPDQVAARLGTASTVTDYPDQIAARLGESPSLSMIMTESLLADRYGNASYLDRIATEGLLADRYGVAGVSLADKEALFAARYNSNPSIAGVSLADKEALFAARYNSNPSIAGVSLADKEALFAARYNSNPSIAGVSLADKEALFAARYNSNPSIAGVSVSNLNPGEIVLRNLGQDGGLTGLSAGPQTGHQKGLDAPKVAHAGPAKHPVAN